VQRGNEIGDVIRLYKTFKIIPLLLGMLVVLQFILIIILFFTRVATSSLPSQDSVVFITNEHAGEVAVDYIGRGSVIDVTLVTEEYAKIYAVDIRYGNFHYVVYVDGEIGEVVWLDRELVEHKR